MPGYSVRMPDVDPAAPADPAPAVPGSASLTLPAVPLRDNVVFPSQLAPLAAGRPRSVAALEAAVNGDGRVVLAIQRDAERDEASIDDVHSIAVIAHVGAFRRLPGGGAHALVEGKERVRIDAFDASGDAWIATVTPIPLATPEGTEVDAFSGSVRALFAEYVNAGAQVGADTAVAMARASQPELIADIASTCPDFGFDDRVALLQETDAVARLRRLIPLLAREVEVAQLRSKIHEDVQKTINNSQREHILREQLRAIRKELSELDDAGEDDEDLSARVEKAGMPDNVKQRVLKEVHRLEQIPSASPEMGMVRTWVDWLLDLPWVDPPAETLDIERAAAVLDEDHYGLTKVKDRILEWLAVRERIRAKGYRRAGRRRSRERRRWRAGEAPIAAGKPQIARGRRVRRRLESGESPRSHRTRRKRPGAYGRRARDGSQETHSADPDPLLRRSPRRRQDIARPQHRARPRPQVRAHEPRRHPRRGGDSRSSPYVHRSVARTHHPVDAHGRDAQRRDHAR